jgi:uncharacterized protein
MKIKRIYHDLNQLIDPNKVLVIYGARRIGKTTLVEDYLKTTSFRYRFDTGEDVRVQATLSSSNLDLIKDYVGENELIVIDEAQNVPDIGLGLKLMVDQIPNIRVITTGSASFDLASKIGEPLVGRKWTKILYPVSQMEMMMTHSKYELRQKLEKYLVFGGYPEVISATSPTNKRMILEEISSSYLFKDILALEKIKSSKLLVELLKLLAFQIGNEVSHSELGSQLGIDKKTVARYLDLLEKAFVIVCLPPFSRNLRKAISKKNKYYFVDNGIRNAIINNFNSLDTRNDQGQLWENFLVMERLKKQAYTPIYSNNYFWRTYDQREIDWVEEREGKIFGFEFKWQKNNSKNKRYWLESYPEEAEFKLINQDNYLDFIANS